MGKIKANNYFTVQGFMVTDLKLTGNELIAYAVIYGFSQAEGQYMTCSQSYIAEWCNLTRSRVNDLLERLVKKGLIEKRLAKQKGAVKLYDYKAIVPDTPREEKEEQAESRSPQNQEKFTSAETAHVKFTSAETAHVTSAETAHVTSAETAHHNEYIDNNILDKSHIISYQELIEEVKEQIEYDYLKDLEYIDNTNLDEVVEVIGDVLTSTSETIRVNRENKPTEVVKARYLKLNREHIGDVITRFMTYTKEVRNPKAIIQTMLYNALETSNHIMINTLAKNGYIKTWK